ncbi:MAG: hypothetical protein KF841_13000 [Phycisphaerae bacterium]|nr:hypothetical protein [Phycisphaerae bacterium]
MSVGTADIEAALAPLRDGVVARALGELDEKLKAWSILACALNENLVAREKAFAAASPGESEIAVGVPKDKGSRSAVLSRLTEPAPLTSEGPVQTNEVRGVAAKSDLAVAPGIAAESEVAAALPASAPTSATGAGVEAVGDGQSGAGLQDDAALLAALTPEQAEAINARYAFFKGSKTIRELIQEFEDEADDEESLLMSLDPDVAKAVRVKYRLYNGRKTLREVIAEVEAAGTKPVESEKKSWWRR